MPGDLLGKRWVGTACEHGNRQRPEFIILRHRPCSNWLGWKDYSALRASPLRGRPSGVILPLLTHPLGPFPIDESFPPKKVGWGGRIRTSEWRDQNPLPYHLATPQLGKQASFSRSSMLKARGSHSVREPENLQTLAASCASILAQDPWSHRPKTHRPQCQSGAQNQRAIANRAHVQLQDIGVAPRPGNRSFHRTPGNREL